MCKFCEDYSRYKTFRVPVRSSYADDNFCEKIRDCDCRECNGCSDDNLNFAFTDNEIVDMFENYIPKVLQYFKDTGNTYSYKQLLLYKPTDFINSPERFPENKTIPCYIQLSEMTVDVDGNCYNCSHLYRDGVKPERQYNVNNIPLFDCFNSLKRDMNGIYNNLSCKCMSGCNTNLIGFNRAVNEGNWI